MFQHLVHIHLTPLGGTVFVEGIDPIDQCCSGSLVKYCAHIHQFSSSNVRAILEKHGVQYRHFSVLFRTIKKELLSLLSLTVQLF